MRRSSYPRDPLTTFDVNFILAFFSLDFGFDPNLITLFFPSRGVRKNVSSRPVRLQLHVLVMDKSNIA